MSVIVTIDKLIKPKSNWSKLDKIIESLSLNLEENNFYVISSTDPNLIATAWKYKDAFNLLLINKGAEVLPVQLVGTSGNMSYRKISKATDLLNPTELAGIVDTTLPLTMEETSMALLQGLVKKKVKLSTDPVAVMWSINNIPVPSNTELEVAEGDILRIDVPIKIVLERGTFVFQNYIINGATIPNRGITITVIENVDIAGHYVQESRQL